MSLSSTSTNDSSSSTATSKASEYEAHRQQLLDQLGDLTDERQFAEDDIKRAAGEIRAAILKAQRAHKTLAGINLKITSAQSQLRAVEEAWLTALMDEAFHPYREQRS